MYRKEKTGWLKHWDFVTWDIISFQLAFIAAYGIRNGSLNPYGNLIYRDMAMVIPLLQIAVMFFGESFKNVLKRGYYQEMVECVKHSAMLLIITQCWLYMTKTGSDYSRITFFTTGILYCVIGYLGRIGLKWYLRKRGVNLKGVRSLLVLTYSNRAVAAVEQIRRNNYVGLHVVGLALTDMNLVGDEIEGVPVVASMNTVEDYVCREWVDEILIDLPEDRKIPQKVFNNFLEMGVTVHRKLFENEPDELKQRVEKVGGFTVLTSSIRIATWRQVFIKRGMDILGGLVGCLITAVLFLFVAPCIFIQSPGPIFFAQQRVGRNGKKFKMYKFRSMYMDAEERKEELMAKNRVKDGLMFKLDHDPRIIGGDKGIGGIIRKYSIDEFPQFWNVLKGEMSLVGTRPPTLDEWDRYELHHRVRLAIKPGITGMWQISGRSEITDFEEVVKLDRDYIMNWSIGLDVKIILKTILVVFGKSGAM